MSENPGIGSDHPDPETIWVECPHCGQQFPIHDAGDARFCITCETRFQTFENVIAEPDFPEWKCPHCHRLYDEKPDECKCQRDGQPFEWLFQQDERERHLTIGAEHRESPEDGGDDE